MKKFFNLALFFLCAVPAVAEEAQLEAVMETPAEAVETIITHKIEKEILPLPKCDDEKLLAKTKEFLNAYFAQNDNQSTLFRRRRYFLLNKLTDFTEENVANYKTAATRPVSDTIVELQINEKILEENMRLCKKTAISKVLGDVYLLVYPFEDGYKVHILNLDRRALSEKNTFTY